MVTPLVLLVAAATAGGPEHPATLEGVWAALAEASALRASFQQTQHRRLFSRPLESAGTVTLQRPDRLRWEVDTPSPSVFVMRGSDVAVTYPALGVTESLSLRDRPELLSLARALTVWMQADLEQVRASYEVSLEGRTATLVPRDPALARWVSRVELTVAPEGRHVQRLALHEPDGDRVEIGFSRVELDPTLAPAAFTLP